MPFLDEIAKKREEEFMSHISEEVLERFNDPKPINLEEYMELRANSYERKLLFSKYDDETLIHVIEHAIKNSPFRELYKFDIPRHYDEAITGQYLPELIRRFKKHTKSN